MDLNVKDDGTTKADGLAGQDANELFDVVNKRDEVIGQARREEVHAQRRLHRAVHIFCFDRAGRVFLQQRSMRKDSAPGRWCASCSGHVDAGEAYDAAAVRELAEEIGVRLAGPEGLTRWLRMEPSRETGCEFVWVYRLVHEGPFTLNAAEVMGGAWYTRAEVEAALQARAQDFAGAFRRIWAALPW
jgi:isopentenyl-diphosphate Delta-isomerase